MAAVSARMMRGPNEMGTTKLCDFSSFFSSSVKPPSGPTKTAEGVFKALRTLKRTDVGLGFIAVNQRPALLPCGQYLLQLFRLQDFGHMDQIALLGRFNDIGAHAIEIYPLCHGAAGHYGAQTARAQFRCFLHHIVKARMLERCKNIINIGGQFRLGHKPLTTERYDFLLTVAR